MPRELGSRGDDRATCSPCRDWRMRQDGRIPCWPARTFLPAKGNLIRRIVMLRDESLSRIDRGQRRGELFRPCCC